MSRIPTLHAAITGTLELALNRALGWIRRAAATCSGRWPDRCVSRSVNR